MGFWVLADYGRCADELAAFGSDDTAAIWDTDPTIRKEGSDGS